MQQIRMGRRLGWIVPPVLTLAALYVYVRTMCPTIFWGDGAQLTAAAYTGGIPHPPGYPLYLLLARPILQLGPLESMPYRMNLLSAVSAALAVGVISLLLRRLTRDWISAAAGALLFAFSVTFWSQAVLAEVYAFHILLNAGVLLAVVAWDRSGRRRYLAAAALLYGLSFTHHLMSVLLAPALVFLAATSPRRARFVRELRWTLPLFLAPLLLYAYLPYAAAHDPALCSGDPRTWGNLVEHVSGAQFRDQMFQLQPARLWRQLRQYAGPHEGLQTGLLQTQWALPLLALAPVGLWRLGTRAPRLLVFTLLLFVTSVAYGLTYQIPDIEAYYLPSYLIIAAWMACGFRQLWGCARAAGRRLRVSGSRVLRPATAALALLLAASPLSANWKPNDVHADRSALDYGRTTLAMLKPDAVLFIGGGLEYFPLLYCRHVEGRRPDVTILNWHDMAFPQRLRLTTRLAGDDLRVRIPPDYPLGKRGLFRRNSLVRQIVADNVGRRPVYFHFVGDPERMMRSRYLLHNLEPFYARATTNALVFEVTGRPPFELDAGEPGGRPLVFGEPAPVLELLGCETERRGGPEAPWLRVRYRWRVRDRELAARAQVRVIIADQSGRPQEDLDDPHPGMHSFHRLGQTLGWNRPELPAMLTETYDLSLPPARWRERFRLRVAVLLDGKPLPAAGHPQPLVEVGELPPSLPPDGRYAAASGR